MSEAKVSVCIPAYNNEDVIGSTIEAILQQTYQNIELIIVDDASTDNTVQVVESYQDERIHLYHNEKNLGMVGNWNRCVELATAEYIKLVCADDILLPESIATEVKAIQNDDEIVMTINDSIMINMDKKELGVFRRYYVKGVIDGRSLARKTLVVSNHFGMPCAVLFRKSIFDKVGKFDEQFKYILDFDLWLKMAPLGKVAVLPEKLNYFMLRKESNTGKLLLGKNDEYYQEHVKLLNKHAKLLEVGKFSVFLSKVSRKIRNKGYGLWLKMVLTK